MRRIIAGLAGLMLAGCGAADDSAAADGPLADHSIDPATGETRMTIPLAGSTATLLAGPTVPVSLPDGFTLFPGTRIANNARFAQAGGEGSLVTFASDAPAAAVIAHYREQAAAAGFAITVEHEAADSLLLIGERARDGARIAVSATATPGAATTGQLVLSTTAPR